MTSLPDLNLPAALLRFWPGQGDQRQALEIAADLARAPTFARLGEQLFAVLPVGGHPGVFDTAVRWSAELQSRLLRGGGTGREISGTLVFPGRILQRGERLTPADDPLLEDLNREPPELPPEEIFFTGYAARWLRGRYRFEDAGLYGGPSGRRVPLYRLAGEAAELLPWHNPEILRKRIAIARPAVTAALAEAARHPGFRVRGALGVGKGHAVWHFLTARGEPRIWIGVGRALPGTAVLAPRLLAEIGRLAPGVLPAYDLGGTPAETAELVLAGLRAAAERLPARPWVVCDVFQTITEADLDLLARLLADPRLAEACRLILIGRTGLDDPPAVADLPAVDVPRMGAEEASRHRKKLLAGLGMSEAMRSRWGEIAAGNPLVLEEGLVGLVHRGSIRRVYGSFFFDGDSDAAYEPSQRWVRHVEAEARRLGEPLPVRILATADEGALASDLELAAAELGVELGADWQRPYVAAGWLEEKPSPRGPILAFTSAAHAIALLRTVAAESVDPLRRTLGRVLAAHSRSPDSHWRAYRLLAGSPEALPSLLDTSPSRGADQLPSREELLEALVSEVRLHRQRGGDEAAELDLLWTLLPMSHRVGRLKEFGAELERALELAGGRPRRHVALLTLKAELDQEMGRFREAEENLRRALAESEGSGEKRRAAVFVRLGDLLMRQGRLAEAKEMLEDLLGLVEPQGQAVLAATCRYHLGNIALREKRLEDALLHHDEACRIRKERKLLKQLGSSLSALGATYLELGDYPRALDFYREAEKVILEQEGSVDELTFVQRGSGRALTFLGDHVAATRPLRRALGTREGRDVVGESLIRLDLAVNQLALGNVEPALSEARRAHFQLSLIPETPFLGDAEQLLGRILFRQHQEATARNHFNEACRLHLKHGDRWAAALDCSWLIELAVERNDRAAIEAHSVQLEELLEDLRYPAFAELLYFRLYKAFDWLRRRRFPARKPESYLRRAYRELMRKTGFLSPEQRHAFLYQILEHQELLDAAAEHDLSFPGS